MSNPLLLWTGRQRRTSAAVVVARRRTTRWASFNDSNGSTGGAMKHRIISVATLVMMALSAIAIADSDKGNLAAQFRLAQRNAEKGDPFAQVSLGDKYQAGEGVPQNYVEAVKWFQEASDRGYFRAQWRLGMAYMLGKGVPRDKVMAHKWFNLAGAGGSSFVPPDANWVGDVGEFSMRVSARNWRDQLEKEMTREQISEAQKLAKEWKAK